MTSPDADLPIYVDFFRRMLALADHYLHQDSKILDFGCGAGKFVYHFRDAGFDAHGFDIHDYLQLRSPEDRQYFRFAIDGAADSSDMSVDWNRYRLPYPDATFDFVLSFETLEHVLNHEAVLRELARVMKPGGIAVHIFPPKYRYLEGHTYVPFGGVTKSYWYNLFWAALGIRNEFQKGLSARETARRNVRYAHTGTNYPSIFELRRLARKYYGAVHFAPEYWHVAWGHYGWRLTRPARLAYTLLNEIVWVLEKPRHDLVTERPSAPVSSEAETQAA